MTVTEPLPPSPTESRGTGTLLAGTAPTPAGLLGVVVTAGGTVRAAGFGPLDDLVARFARTAGRVGGRTAVEQVRPVGLADLPEPVVDALRRYADADPGALDEVPVLQPGGAFFQEVWLAMRRVPPATTVTYTGLATMAGRPTAVRAAGTACARNLVAPFVPCHRIVRTDGTLGGYAYGLGVKRALLAHEKADSAT